MPAEVPEQLERPRVSIARQRGHCLDRIGHRIHRVSSESQGLWYGSKSCRYSVRWKSLSTTQMA